MSSYLYMPMNCIDGVLYIQALQTSMAVLTERRFRHARVRDGT